MISAIIPTLNAAGTLALTLDALAPHRGGLVAEVLVIDGGSTDSTVDIAIAADCKVIHTNRGRDGQLRHGALMATQDCLLFLHADTRLDHDWGPSVTAFMILANEGNVAGVFQFALDDRGLRLVSSSYWSRTGSIVCAAVWRSGLVDNASAVHEVGGFQEFP